jgi:hypothetical protein
MKKLLVLFLMLLFLPFGIAAKMFSGDENILKHYKVDSPDEIISKTSVTIDKVEHTDGNASLKIDATNPIVIKLYETGNINIENAKIVYQAKLKTNNFKGMAYLEMWCHFKDKGSFFSRDLATPITSDTDWITEETPFFLKKGENPDNISLNLVINGTGTVWIDDVKLLKKPLK